MKNEISTLSSDQLDQNSLDSLALIFASKYTPTPIQLHDIIKEDGGEVEKEIQNRRGIPTPGRGTPTQNFQRIKVRLPFDGEKDLLLHRSSTYNHNPPEYNELNRNQIVYYVDYRAQNREPDEIKEEVQNEIENWVEDVNWWVEQLNQDIRSMEDDFEREARSELERRQEEVKTKQQVMDDLGVDTGSSEDQGYVKPEKKRSIEIPESDEDNHPEILPDQTFLDILDIVDDLGINIERSKQTVRELDEEGLRDIFLLGINSHYAGLATGESFNRGGKTDILLRHQNRNLFIAECKFWRGPSKYEETIDQLLGNLSVRDSHASLLIFSRNKDFTQVQQKIRQATRDHDNYESQLPEFEDHQIYRFQLDSGTPVKLNVKAFNLLN